MKILKYLLGVWAAVAIYALFSFLAGPKGLSAYNYLLSEKDRQWNNIKELGILYEELERTQNNLLYDQDTMLVHARQMGYGRENERFIRIVGLSNVKQVTVQAGNVYIAQNPDFISDRSIKIAAISIGLMLFAFLLTLEIIESKSR